MKPAAIIADTYLYEIASHTYQNVSYDITVDAAGEVLSCSCPDHVYRHRACKHMKAFAATIAAEKAAEEAAAVAEVEAMIAEQARIEKAARFEAVKAEIEAINAKYAEAKAALVTEIISTFEQEREEMIATFEEKEAALERKVKAIIKANEYRQELENSVWNSPLVVTNSKAVKETAVKRAPQFQNMDILKALPLNGNAPFSLLKVS